MATRTIPVGAEIAGDLSQHYVDWAAVFGGVAVAAGISIVLFAFGTAIGFSMVSPYEGEGVSKAWYFTALGLWTVWVVVSSFMAGGYIAGRLRRRTGDATEHESDVRDGAHGLIVWGVGIVLASMLLMVGVSGVAGSTLRFAAAMTPSDDGRGDVVAYTVDSLFRTTDRTTAVSNAERREVARILTQGTLRGDVTADNRAYLAKLVSARAGISASEGEQRVNEVLADAKHKADIARKTGIVTGFLTAAALFVAGAAAAWSAALGGRHRDRGTETGNFWRWV